jgi:hypothetical protein
MFRNQSLEPELASLAEQMRADFALLEGCEEDPIWPPFQQPREVGFAQAQWQLAQIITVEREAIERVKLNLGILAGTQSVEIGHPVDEAKLTEGLRSAPPKLLINRSGAPLA